MIGRHHPAPVPWDIQLVKIHRFGIPESPGIGFPHHTDPHPFRHQLEDQLDAADDDQLTGADSLFLKDPVLECPGTLVRGGSQEYLSTESFRLEDAIGLPLGKHSPAVQRVALGHRYQEFLLEQLPGLHGPV